MRKSPPLRVTRHLAKNGRFYYRCRLKGSANLEMSGRDIEDNYDILNVIYTERMEGKDIARFKKKWSHKTVKDL